MHPILIIYFLIATLAIRFLKTVYDNNIASSTRAIPGPFLARFTRLYYLFQVNKGSFHWKNIALHQKYRSSIVRVGPGLYSVSDPDKAIYGIGSKFPKSDWYEAWKHPSTDQWALFADRDMKRHAANRRHFQAMYSLSSLVTYEPYVDACTEIFSEKLRHFAEGGITFDMGHWFQCYAFDVIGNITYSKRFGFLDGGEDQHGIISALHTNLQYSTLIGIYAWLHPYLFRLMQFMPNSGAAGKMKLMAFVEEQIRQRKQGRHSRGDKKGSTGVEEGMPHDFLEKISDAHDDNPQKVTEYHIFTMNLSNIIAGSDTTAIALSSMLYHLIKYPETMARLRKEIDATASAQEGNLRFSQSQHMPYLQAVIKESMRMHSAVGLPLWREVPDGGAEVCGHYLPAGTSVGYNSWVGHYDEAVFGTDARVFNPDRWIEAEANGGERLQRMEAHHSPFGFGSRTCIGRHISILEISKLIPQLVRQFDFELETPDEEWKTNNLWFVKASDCRMKVRFRPEYQHIRTK